MEKQEITIALTLRDYFAAHALIANIQRLALVKHADPNNVVPAVPMVTPEAGAEMRRAIAKLSYDYADEMVAAREKGGA